MARVGSCWGPSPSVLTGYATALDRHGPGRLSSLRPLGLPDQEEQKRSETGKFQDPELTGAASGLRPCPGPHCSPSVGISPAAPRSWGSQGGLTRRGEVSAHHPHGPQKPPAVKSIHRSLGVQLPSPTITCRYLDFAGPARHAPKVGFWGEGGCSWLTAYI